MGRLETALATTSNPNPARVLDKDWAPEQLREFLEADSRAFSKGVYVASTVWGTIEGIFGALFLALTWNLVCRGNNTAKIRFSHLTWTTFDAMKVNFKHTKTQQHGEAKRQKRAVFSNPFEYYIDIPFLFGLYLASVLFL